MLSSPIALPVLLAFHFLIGGLATAIAYRKGRNLPLWLLWGAIGGTAALVVALTLKPEKS